MSEFVPSYGLVRHCSVDANRFSGVSMRNSVFVVALLAGLAAPAFAQAQQSGEPSSDEAHMNEVVCKKQPPPTGSRLPGKTVCLSNREWQAIWDESKRATNGMQNKSISNGPTGG